MASSKYYAYYVRGSQIAIIEHDNVTGDGQTLDQPGLNDVGPSGGYLWKSPIATVTDGIEIEYAYSPRYVLPNTESSIYTNTRTQFYLNGWINVGGYLTFVNSGLGWASYNNLNVDEYIVIRGSARWNGVHKVKEIQSKGNVTHGSVKTYTRVTDESPFTTDSSVDWATSTNRINNLQPLSFDHFDEDIDPYVWLSGSDDSANSGMFSGWSKLDSVTLGFDGGTRYAYTTNLVDEDEVEVDFDNDPAQDLYMYKAYHEPNAYMITGVEVLEDESDTIDLPEYLTKALVYYIKAKLAEDLGAVDHKDYNLKEFRRMLEKHENSKIWGARMIGPGPSAIR